MKKILLQIPEKRVRQLDKLIEKKEFPNRNEAIREGIRMLLNSDLYVSREKLQNISQIWHRWNKWELDASEALSQMHNQIMEA